MTANLCRVAAVICCIIVWHSPAFAQEQAPPELPATLTDAEIDAFVARLNDDGVRRLLIAQLQGQAETETAAPQSDMVVALERDALLIRTRLAEVLVARKNGPEAIGNIWREITADGAAWFLFSVAVLLAAGIGLEALLRRYTSDVRQRIDHTPEGGWVNTLCHLLLRAVIDLLGIAAFALGGFGAFVLVDSNPNARRFVATFVALAVIIRLLSVVSRFFLSPRAPQLRLLAVNDADALALHRWVLWIFGTITFSVLTLTLLKSHGVTAETAIMQKILISIFVLALLLTLVWRRRQQVADLIRDGLTSEAAKASPIPGIRLRGQLADVWPVLATVYILGIWTINLGSILLDRGTGAGPATLSLAVLLILPALDWMVGQLLQGTFSRRVTAVDGTVTVVVDPHSERSIGAIRRGIRILLLLCTVAALLFVWGFDFAQAAQNPIIARVAEPLFNAAVILVLGYVAWQVLKSMIDRRLDAEGGDITANAGDDQEAEEGGGDPGTRLQTLLPLFRKFAIGLIVVLVALSVLSSFGINIAPLLAGAGVVGIAIGFGAQALVRDVFSGLFFLIDDAFRVGEYIEIDSSLMGTVESISVRSMKLRHHRGALHVLPFGELRSITNRTRGWVIEKLDLRLPYDTDVEQVRKIIKRIGIEMMEDPDLGPRMIAPLKSQGVYKLEDSAMILRAKFTSKPRGRAKVRREAQIRIKRAFDEAGIQFAHRQVTVHVPEGEGGDKAAAGAAAAAALATQEEQDAAPAGAKA